MKNIKGEYIERTLTFPHEAVPSPNEQTKNGLHYRAKEKLAMA